MNAYKYPGIPYLAALGIIFFFLLAWVKRLLNRFANIFIKMMFRIPLNDTTNAFKAYRWNVINGLRPILFLFSILRLNFPLKPY